LLQQDLKSALKVLGQDEIDDAHALLRKAGYRPADFEILQRCDRSPQYVAALAGDAIVIRKSNRVAKAYRAGHLSNWLFLLESDLASGAFGQP